MTATIYVLDHWRPAPLPPPLPFAVGDHVVIPSQPRLGVGRVTGCWELAGSLIVSATFAGAVVRTMPARQFTLFEGDDAPGAA